MSLMLCLNCGKRKESERERNELRAQLVKLNYYDHKKFLGGKEGWWFADSYQNICFHFGYFSILLLNKQGVEPCSLLINEITKLAH
jgi:hypothetical protein